MTRKSTADTDCFSADDLDNIPLMNLTRGRSLSNKNELVSKIELLKEKVKSCLEEEKTEIVLAFESRKTQ